MDDITGQTVFPEDDERWMRQAIELAQKAAEQGEVPVGALVIRNGQVIAQAANQVESLKDACAHAEMLALKQAQTAVGDWRLDDCVLVVTKEPCPMCAGAISNCRIGRVVFGVPDPRMGACGSAMDITSFPGMLHTLPVTAGVLADEARDVLQAFFRKRRQEAREIHSHETNAHQ